MPFFAFAAYFLTTIMLAQILVKLRCCAVGQLWKVPVFTLSMFARIAGIPRTQQQR
jgi:hypothetical protein